MFNYIKRKVIEYHCKKDNYYQGKRGRIQKVGYPDRPAWCVAIYKCSDISQSVKTFDDLNEALDRLMKVERDEI